MTSITTKFPATQVLRLGNEVYDRQIRSSVESGHLGRIVGIDVDSEDFEIGDDVLQVFEGLLPRNHKR